MRIFSIIFLLIFAVPATAAETPAAHSGLELIPDRSALEPGMPLTVGVHFRLDAGWHIYWRNAGDSGTPPMIKWTLPEGFAAGPIQWPYPHRINVDPLTSYGYERHVSLLQEIAVPAQLAENIYEFKARAEFLICEKICLPAEADLAVTLPVMRVANFPFLGSPLDEARTKLPLKESSWKIAARATDKEFIFTFIPPSSGAELSSVEFFPYRDDLIRHAAEQKFSKHKNYYSLTVLKSSLAPQTLDRISGVFVSAGGWGNGIAPQALEADIALGPMAPAAPQDQLSILTAIVFAVIGGLILNLMPCVLPVLSIKVMNLIEHKTDSRSGLVNGGVFTLGVLVSFWLLAGILIALKAGGQQIGWGFQFQSPAFLIGLSVFFFVFALNLWGVFEIGTSLTSLGGRIPKLSGYAGHFMTGVMATIVATPCTAPFMGTALGFALVQPWTVTILIFTALGLGMSLPYLALAGCPSLLKFIPKPGPWMITLKKILAVFLLLTVAWLLWVLVQLKTGPVRGTAAVEGEGLAWQEYSPELIDRLRAENRRIFIDFTAAWCLTCQVNDRLVLRDPAVVKKFAEAEVVPVKADWTAKDERITSALAGFGRNSIPFYVLYPSDKNAAPVILPEILSKGIVLDALNQLKSQ